MRIARIWVAFLLAGCGTASDPAGGLDGDGADAIVAVDTMVPDITAPLDTLRPETRTDATPDARDMGPGDLGPEVTPDVQDAAVDAGSDPCDGVSCDDADRCTRDSCDPKYGCVHERRSCDDDDDCTLDGCTPDDGCTWAPIDCNDASACTTDGCDQTTGCTHAPIPCGDDGDPCTVDTCDPAVGCVTPSLDCGDDVCIDGACVADVPCDTVEDCPSTFCAPLDCVADVCVPLQPPCDDEDACTVDVCDVDACQHLDAACDDGNPCTSDTCFPETGCVHSLDDVPCVDPPVPVGGLFVGVWSAELTGPTQHRHAQTEPQFLAEAALLEATGWRLRDLDVRDEGGVARFDSVYGLAADAQQLLVTTDTSELAAVTQQAEGDGLAMVDLGLAKVGNETVYTAVWRADADPTSYVPPLPWADFEAQAQLMADAGMRLVDIEVLEASNGRRWAGLFATDSTGKDAYVTDLTWDAFAKAAMDKAYLRLVDVEVYGPSGAPLFAGVWAGDSTAERLSGGQPWDRFTAEDARQTGKARALVDIEHYEGTAAAPPAFAATLYDLLNGSAVGYGYALAKDGVPMAYGSVGYARAPWDFEPEVSYAPETRTHIASVSKAICGTAYMVAGIDVDQPFYPLLADDYPTVGSGVEQVTLRHLLTHRSGMDNLGLNLSRCNPFDSKLGQLVASDTLAPPGMMFAYSNTNFCIARAVFEVLLGEPYEAWVQRNIFAPVQVWDANTLMADTAPTLYYEPLDDGAPGNNGLLFGDFSSDVGAYGWYASPVDLIRFLTGLRRYDLAPEGPTETMFSDELGWRSWGTSAGPAFMHDGIWYAGNTGAHSVVFHFPDGWDAVVLANSYPVGVVGAAAAAFSTLWDDL